MKYRRLTIEELINLEKDFVNFLVVNTITADEWERLKETQPDKAEKLIETFSDFVFETIFQKTLYLDYRSERKIYAYQCLPEKLVVVGIEASEQSPVNFSKPDFFNEIKVNSASLKIFTSDKKYNKQREVELFEMVQKGCEIADGKLFRQLCLAL